MLSVGATESFTAEERARLAPYFTNVDAPVFALVNLPEVVKGALFARYSRSPKSLRRLFLDEFADAAVEGAAPAGSVGTARAERLFERVFVEYGDDSVAQLGGVHLACEGVSNVLTKLLEWGRLMAYLEQSTRYVPYADRPGGRWRYHVPAEVRGTPLEREFEAALDLMFETYARWLEPMQEHFRRRHPRQPSDCRGRLPEHHPGKGARHPPRAPSGRDAVERGTLRHGPGVRGPPAPTPGVPARRGARLRGPHADGAAQGDPGVSPSGRHGRSRRRLVGLPRRHRRGRGVGGRTGARPARSGAAPGGGPRGLRSRGRDEGRGRRALRRLRPSRRPAPRARPADDRRGAGGGPARVRGRARGTGGTSRDAPSSGPATGSTS